MTNERLHAATSSCFKTTSKDSDEKFVKTRLTSIWITGPFTVEHGRRRLAIKDLFDTAGIRTTYGSAIFAEHIPSRNATAVQRLESAGWRSVGKANLHEFAYGITSQNDHYGTVPNPRYPGRTSGGSSGGSAAALAAGLADGALGTDTGGSIRIPAACCGVTGFKPSFGLVSLDGVFPLAPSFDHAGPLAQDVGGCVELMQALVPDLRVSPLESLEEVIVGVAWPELAEPKVCEQVSWAASLFPRRRLVDAPLADEVRPAFMREVGDVHRELFAKKRRALRRPRPCKVRRLPRRQRWRVRDGAGRARDAPREGTRSAQRLRSATHTDPADRAPGRRRRRSSRCVQR